MFGPNLVNGDNRVTILAIAGSLRRRSSYVELVRAVQILSPAGVTIEIYDSLDSLPHFNPDLEADAASLPAPVKKLRSAVDRAGGILISSPEYARGIPGSLKNALDWLVGSPSFAGTPVALFNASPRGVHARAALRLVLSTMGARSLPETEVTVPLLGIAMTGEEIAQTFGELIREAVTEFVREIRQGLKRQ